MSDCEGFSRSTWAKGAKFPRKKLVALGKKFIGSIRKKFKWKGANFIGKIPWCSKTWKQSGSKRNRLRDTRIR